MTTTSFSQQKVGVVLSGGGALGFAHIGALQAIEEAGYQPTIISGTSMGSLVGVFYAAGYSPIEILDIVKDEHLYSNSRLLRMRVSSNPGIYNLDAIRAMIKQYIPSNSFDSLPRELFVCVMDLVNATAKYIGTGNQLAEYTVASASIPTIFEAQTINGVQYVDGGVANNFPAQPIREKCDFLIGIDVLPLTNKKAEKAFDSFLISYRDVNHINSLPGREMCDVLVEIRALDKYNEFDFKKYAEIYKIGYETTQKRLQELGIQKQ